MDHFSDIYDSDVFSSWEIVFAKTSDVLFDNTKDTSLGAAIDSRHKYSDSVMNKYGTRYS